MQNKSEIKEVITSFLEETGYFIGNTNYIKYFWKRNQFDSPDEILKWARANETFTLIQARIILELSENAKAHEIRAMDVYVTFAMGISSCLCYLKLGKLSHAKVYAKYISELILDFEPYIASKSNKAFDHSINEYESELAHYYEMLANCYLFLDKEIASCYNQKSLDYFLIIGKENNYRLLAGSWNPVSSAGMLLQRAWEVFLDKPSMNNLYFDYLDGSVLAKYDHSYDFYVENWADGKNRIENIMGYYGLFEN